MGTICDITLKDNLSELFSEIFSNTGDAIICIDCVTCEILLFNPGAEKMFGVDAEKILGEDITTIIPDKFIDTGDRINVTALNESGERFLVEIVTSVVSVNSKDICALIIRDMSAQEKLHEYRKVTKRKLLKEVSVISQLQLHR